MNTPEQNEEVTRRGFLQGTAAGASGVAIVITTGAVTLVSANAVTEDTVIEDSGEESTRLTYEPKNHGYVFLVDVTKCIGCGSCIRACERENDVPTNYFRTWIERYEVFSVKENAEVDSPNGGRDGFDPRPTDKDIKKAFFVPKLCNHCTLTPCVQLCPVGASYRTPDGVILVDEKRCIGCSYCVQACPYGSRFIHPDTHTASKCTLCYHRTTQGLPAACVQACPRGARRIGDTKQVGDEVTAIIARSQVHVLKPELHTQPNCFYIGLSREVH